MGVALYVGDQALVFSCLCNAVFLEPFVENTMVAVAMWDFTVLVLMPWLSNITADWAWQYAEQHEKHCFCSGVLCPDRCIGASIQTLRWLFFVKSVDCIESLDCC